MIETAPAKELLTVRDVAPILGVSPRRVQGLIRAKKLPAVQTGTRAVRIPRAAFEEHLRRLNAAALASMETTENHISTRVKETHETENH